MLDFIWDTKGYFFWLLAISMFCWALERIAPWRPEQRAFRNQFWQDVFWLVFNGHYAGVLLAYLSVWIFSQINQILDLYNLPDPQTLSLLSQIPLWIQFIIYFLISDFIEWGVHNLLHRVSWMWEIHKLHHSIVELDWIGNFRFNWMEIVIYKSIKYLPLVILGVDAQVILWIAVIATFIGHLNHANFRTDWGKLRYIFNSPRLHIWHHDVVLHGNAGQNYAIVFSIWDWLFGTIYYPTEKDAPDRLGFQGIHKFPQDLVPRFIYPFIKI
jgi:sterol desaturase/sphingolipid hydroxylase (fatty acid hydroxylase superfamily)